MRQWKRAPSQRHERRHLGDGALERRFQTVVVDPPSVEETVEILKGLRKRYEDHHRVTIPDETLGIAAKLSERYITDRFLPDKAIDLMDEAASRIRMQVDSKRSEEHTSELQSH